MAKKDKIVEVKKVIPAQAPAKPTNPSKQYQERITSSEGILAGLDTVLGLINKTKNPPRSLKFAATRIREAKQMLERDMKGLKAGLAKHQALKVPKSAETADEKSDEKKSEESAEQKDVKSEA